MSIVIYTNICEMTIQYATTDNTFHIKHIVFTYVDTDPDDNKYVYELFIQRDKSFIYLNTLYITDVDDINYQLITHSLRIEYNMYFSNVKTDIKNGITVKFENLYGLYSIMNYLMVKLTTYIFPMDPKCKFADGAIIKYVENGYFYASCLWSYNMINGQRTYIKPNHTIIWN